MLKGRANYVCHYHLERARNDGRFLNRDDVVYLARIESYAKTSKTGDRSGLAEVPEDATVWPLVTSTRENCLGGDCPNYKDCFVMEARKQALDADVVVVNHHLFFADVVLRDEGVSELLPACNTVIFDEAHQLPETASLFFGESVSSSQLVELARDTRIEAATSAKDNAALPEAAAALEKSARDLRLQFREDAGRQPYSATKDNPAFASALDAAMARLTDSHHPAQVPGRSLGGIAELLDAGHGTARQPGPLGGRRGQGLGALDRDFRRLGAPERDAFVDRGHLPPPDHRQSARLDIHFGDAVGAGKLFPLPARDGTG